jgi:hypothetical protein
MLWSPRRISLVRCVASSLRLSSPNFCVSWDYLHWFGKNIQGCGMPRLGWPCTTAYIYLVVLMCRRKATCSDAHEAASRARGEARVLGEGGELASCGEWRRGLWRTREVLASIPPSRGPREHSRTDSFFVTKTGGVSCRSICGHRQGEARSPGRSGTTVVEKGKQWC